MAMWMLARERLGRELYEALGYALASRPPEPVENPPLSPNGWHAVET
jgi:hypothetical protein